MNTYHLVLLVCLALFILHLETSSARRRRRRRRRHTCSSTNCRWGDWSVWGACTHPCGNNGTQIRTRGIAVHAYCGGAGCSGPSSQKQDCNRFCRNGGTPNIGFCDCPDENEYWGTCCDRRQNATSNLQGTATVSSLTATWDPPPGESVTGFRVELWKANITGKTLTPLDVTQTTFHGLLSAEKYTVIVVTLDGKTESFPLENSFYTKPNFPSSIHDNTTAKAMIVTWDAPSGHVTGYAVELKNVSNTQQNVTGRTATFINLTPDTMYTLLITCLAGDDDTGYEISAPLEVELYTKPALWAVAISSTTVRVIWSPGEESKASLYQMRYHGRNQSTDWSSERTIHEGDTRVTGLFPGDQYTFEVRVVGEDRNDTYVTTTVATYPLPPTDLAVSDVTTNSFKLDWQYDSSKSWCLKWKVKYTDQSETKEINTNNTDERNMVIGNLYSGKTYTVDIFGVTVNEVVGATSIQVEVTVKPAIVQNLTVYARTPNTLLVALVAPRRCFVEKYLFTITGGPHLETVINGSVPKTTFAGLSAGTQYTIVVVAASGNQRGEPLQRSFFTKPNSARNLRVESRTVVTLTLSWDVPESGQVTEYNITLQNVHGKVLRTKQTSSHSIRKVMFVGLAAGTGYEIVLASLSGDQQSETIEKVFYTKPKVAANLTSTATTNALSLSWDAPSSGLVEKYVVEMMSEAGSQLESADVTSKNNTFTGLTAGTRYDVVITVVSGDQHSDTLQQRCYTKPYAANNLIVVSRTVSSLILTWDAPASGNVIAYAITIQGMSRMEQTISGRANRKVVFDGLTAGRLYTISVVSVSGDMKSDSLEEQFYTKPDVAWNLGVVTRNKSSLVVTWETPVGVVSSYLVELKLNTVQVAQDTILSEDERSATFNGLTAGTEYTVVVRTVSGDQRSDTLNNTFFTRPEASHNLLTGSVTGNSATVTWDPPIAGDFGGYDIYLFSVSGTEHKVKRNAMRNVVFTGLTTGTQYTVVVVTLSGDQQSEILTDTFNTIPEPARNMTVDVRTVHSLTVTWIRPASGGLSEYRVSVQGQAGSEQRVSVSAPRTATFTTLKAGTQYTVVLVTLSGEQRSAAIQRRFYTPPNVPKHLTLSDVSTDYLTVSWNAPMERYTGYKVWLLDVANTEEETVPATRRATFLYLVAGKQYSIVLVAVSGDQKSDELTGTFYTTPNIATRLSSTSTSSSLTVTWDVPDSGLVEKYVAELQTNPSMKQEVSALSVKTTTFSGLEAGTEYAVAMVTWSGTQHSDSVVKHFFTKPNDVQNVLVKTYVDFLIVAWDPPISGLVEKYTAELKYVTRSKKDITDLNNRTAKFVGLKSGAPYRVLVIAVSGIQKSIGIEETYYTFPRNVEVPSIDDFGQSYATVKWTNPAGTRRYIGVTYGKTQSLATVKVNKDAHAQVDGLKPGTNYKFSLYTRSGDKESMRNTISINTRKTTDAEIIRKDSTNTSLTISWKEPTGDVTQYQVAISNITGGNTTSVTIDRGSTLEHTFSDLNPGYGYNITVMVKSGINTISAASRPLHTNPDAPLSLQVRARTTTSVHMQWLYDNSRSAIRMWRVLYSEKGREEIDELITDDVTQRQWTIDNLTPGQTYSIRLFAVTTGDIGSEEPANVTVTLQPRPVVALTASAISTRDVVVKWEPPDGSYQDAYQGFYYSSRDSSWNGKFKLVGLEKTVTDLTPGNTYTFEVKSVSVDEHSEGMTTITTVYPSRPTELMITSTSTNSVTIHWRYNRDNSLCVKWNITYTELDKDNSEEMTVDTGSARDAVIDSLTPGLTYTINVFALTTNDVSSQTSAHIQVTTNPLPVKTLTATSLNSTSVLLTWTSAEGSFQDSYQLRYRISHGSTDWIDQGTVADCEAVVTGLIPGVRYIFGAKAVSRNQTSTEKTITTTLYPLPPDQLDVLTHNITTSSVTVTWQCDKLKSHIEKWRVQYTVKRKSQVTYIDTDSANVLSLSIGNLTSGRNYTVAVYGVTYNDVVSAEAPEVSITVEPSVVAALNLAQRAPSLLVISWKPPKGDLTHYQVDMFATGEEEMHRTSVYKGSPLEKTFRNLQSGQEYNVTVTVMSGVVCGLGVSRLFYTNPLPPTDLEVENTTTDSVTVQWTYSNNHASPIVRWRVVYTETGKTESQESSTYDIDARNMTINSLIAGMTYTIRVYAVSAGDVSSRPTAYLSATVGPLPPSRLEVVNDMTTTTTITVKWTYDNSKSHVEKWRVQYAANCDCILKSMDTSSADVLQKTIGGLSSGENYTIYVYSMTRGGVVSHDATVLGVTVKPEITIDLLEDKQTDTDTVVVFYTNDTGESRFDRYLFSIDDEHSTTLVKEKDDERTVTFESLVAGILYTVTARTESGDVRSRRITTRVLTVPREPTLMCLVEETAITVFLTQRIGWADSFSLTCVDCPDTKTRENLTSHRYTDLIPYSTYTFLATSIAMKQTAGSKESDVAEIKCNASVGPPFAVQRVGFNLTEHNELWLSWDEPCVRNGIIQKYTIEYNWTNSKNTTHYGENITVDAGDSHQQHVTQNITNVMPGYNYMFVIHAYNTMKGTPLVVNYTMPHLDTVEFNQNADMDATAAFSRKDRNVIPWKSVITIGAVIVIAVVVFAILIAAWLKRRNKLREDDSTRGTLIDMEHQPHSGVQWWNLSQFAELWQEMSREALAEEFQKLQEVGRDRETTVAQMKVNGSKNRNPDVLPYDSTRITLMTADSQGGSDYINGSWMPGFTRDQEYAVVQGPLSSTRADFWRMIWDQNAQAIIMLNKCVEKGRMSCVRYWPEASEPMHYGYLKVQVLETNSSADWVVSKFLLLKGSQSRTLTHFQYLDWPDLGVPENSNFLVTFVRLVRRSLNSDNRPLVVHCSTGAGRSGVFVAVDRLLQHIKKYDWVDIYNTVHDMLQHRRYAVQTVGQYRCIYQCVLYGIETETSN